MELIFLFKAAVMGVVEGFTEFLPISSTGHLILAGSLLRFTVSHSFDIAIQTGAILAVLWEYQARFIGTLRGIGHQKKAQRFACNILIAFIPAVIFGLLLGAWIQSHLFHPVPVAMAFILGGLAILWIERRQRRRYGLGEMQVSETQTDAQARAAGVASDSVGGQTSSPPSLIVSVDSIKPMQALQLGLIQCLALIPGTSRSGATIMGGLLLGFSRKTAAEFSFFLGVPTLLGASVYSLYKDRENLHSNDLGLLLVGTIFAGLSAWLCIRWLIHYVSHHDFRIFAWYRIAFGCFILLSAYAGWIDWSN